MFRNHLKTAWRNLIKERTFSLINLMGLVLGITCSLFILLWVQDEKSIDNFHANGKQLYLLYETRYISGQPDAGYGTPGILASQLKTAFPEIEYACNISWLKDVPDQLTFTAADKSLKFDACYGDSDLFKMMSYPLVQGNAGNALASPLSICISEKMANAFFGSANAAYGKTIRYENKKDLKVTGVFKNLPEKASAKFDCLINWSAFLDDNDWAKQWGNSGPNTLIMLQKNANADMVSTKIAHFLDAYIKPTNSYKVELGMQRFGDSYLHSDFKNGKISGGRIEYIQLFSIIAIFILVIACINFMNLSTARSVNRSKEIGVRKVAGATRLSLIRQFLTEALMLTVLAVVIAISLVNLLLPYFNQLTDKNILIPYTNAGFWTGLLLLTIVTGLAAGSYPALLLSSFKPVAVLKKSLKFSGQSIIFRRALVTFQFILSIVLIAATIIVLQQVNYIRKINLGYNKENLIEIPIENSLANKYKLFKQEALNAPGIISVSRLGEMPTLIGSSTADVNWQGKNPNAGAPFTNSIIGYDFVKTMDLKLIAGRDFSREFPSDSTGYIINESAQKLIGYKEAVGKPLTLRGNNGIVIGVLKDFHFSSLHDPIKPLILYFGENKDWGNVLVRIQQGKTTQALAALEKNYKSINSGAAFSYSFVDEDYNKLYQQEQLFGKLTSYFSFLAIFISSLGLLGLVTLTAAQRTKEIGIRKVLGANVVSVFALLSKEFIQLVVLAFAIATPLVWWLMNNWLLNYAYKIEVRWWVFAITGLAVMMIALITISFQSIKAAIANPVKSLRTE
jgi:ABC-type antimicrobial peptide transport system permease subunit